MTQVAARSSSGVARLVWALAAIGALATVLLLWSTVQSTPVVTPVLAITGLSSQAGSLIAFVLSGALIASRQPRNGVGWLLMIPGLILPLSELASSRLAAIHPPPDTVTPALWLLLWAISWSWILLIFPIFHLLLTFPNGRLLSPRWRWAVVLEGAMIATFLAIAAFSATLGVLVNDRLVWTVPNPIGVLQTDPFETDLGTVWDGALLLITAASATAVVVRFRRGSREERQQLKWPLAAVVLFGVVYGATAIIVFSGATAINSSVNDALGGLLWGLAMAGIPISVAIAVLRYRLYEIDRIVSRTIGWIVLTAILAVVFVGVVVGLQAVLAPFTNENTLVVAASTLVAAALFQPLRRRVQRAVDRRFNRARYDAQRMTETFEVQLRQATRPGDADEALVETARAAVEPQACGVWLRGIAK